MREVGARLVAEILGAVYNAPLGRGCVIVSAREVALSNFEYFERIGVERWCSDPSQQY